MTPEEQNAAIRKLMRQLAYRARAPHRILIPGEGDPARGYPHAVALMDRGLRTAEYVLRFEALNHLKATS